MEKLQPDSEPPLFGPRTFACVGALSLAVFAGLLLVLPPLAAALSAYLFLAMVLITLTDLRHFIIPDVLSLPAFPLGLLANALLLQEGDWMAGISEGTAGALAGGGTFYLLRFVYFRLRGIEGLGLGDVKLAAVAGAWLGPGALAPMCLVAAVAAIMAVLVHASLFNRRKLQATAHIPFGSFIAPTILCFWIWRMMDFVPFW